MEGCIQLGHAEGTFREGHRDVMTPKQGPGVSDRGTRTNRDLALEKTKVYLGVQLVPTVEKASSSNQNP